jgi:beta-lactamase regulating signal transducer with metallopeptidase domain
MILPSLMNAETTRVLAWTLIHFLWQGLAIALLLYVALPFCRSAHSRYALSVSALLAMPAACFITFVSLVHDATVTPGLVQAFGVTSPAILSTEGSPGLAAAAHISPVAWLNLFVWCWLGGVALLSIRAFGGWLTLTTLRRRLTYPLPAALIETCRTLERRLQLRQRVRYVQSKMVETPAVIGCLRPVVLLPMAALSGLSPTQLEAIIAHELAHIKRLDALVNFVQIIIETVLFYNPAMWWVSKTIRAEREHCCDDLSVAVCGNISEYVRALTFLESARTMPDWALAANGGPLKARVLRLLKPDAALRTVSTGGLVAVISIVAVGALLASTQIEHINAPAPPAAPVTAISPALAADPTPQRTVSKETEISVNAAAQTRAAIAMAVHAATQAAVSMQTQVAAQASNETGSSYIDSLHAAGLKDFSVDNLIAMKVQGVTADYVREVRAAGFDATVSNLIGMKVQGVTPEYIKEMRAAGLSPNVDQLIGMKVQGVTPAYIRDLRATGVNPSLNEIIGMKVQGITPEYIKSLKAAGFNDLKTGDYIAAKVMGITPEFINQVRSRGFKDLTLHQLIGLKTAGIF